MIDLGTFVERAKASDYFSGVRLAAELRSFMGRPRSAHRSDRSGARRALCFARSRGARTVAAVGIVRSAPGARARSARSSALSCL